MEMPKLPQAPTLTKEQLAKNAEQRRLKLQFKETLWPFLEMSVKDLQEAIALVDLVQMGIEAAWTNKKSKSTLKSLDVKMRDDAPDYKKIKFLLDTLKDETVLVAVNVLNSLKNTVNDYANTTISRKPMSELKPLFDKEFSDV